MKAGRKGKDSPSSQWCFLRDNSRLRALINYKIETSEELLSTIAKGAGVPAYLISSWKNGHKPYMTQYQLVKLCNYLNISINLKIELEK
jgi:hypothetical protein